jgi:branched-subunit amino acid transport protein
LISVAHDRAAMFALCFGFYHSVLGLIRFEEYERPAPAAAALLLYAAVLFFTTRFKRELRLPAAMTVVALFAAVAVPALALYATGGRAEHHDPTWFVAGIGSVMAVLAWRNNSVMAWAGMIAMVFYLSLWGGLEFLLGTGVIGAFAIVGGSQGAAIALKSAQKSSIEFLQWRLTVNLEVESRSIKRAEPLLQLKKALDSSLPLLRLIQQKEGKITSSDSKKLLLAEAGIRDQIRAKGLQNAVLIAAVLSARVRGVEVQLSDDGGIDLLEGEDRERLFKELSRALSGIKAGKVVIRSVAGESWTVSLFASGSIGSQDVFLRL